MASPRAARSGRADCPHPPRCYQQPAVVGGGGLRVSPHQGVSPHPKERLAVLRFETPIESNAALPVLPNELHQTTSHSCTVPYARKKFRAEKTSLGPLQRQLQKKNAYLRMSRTIGQAFLKNPIVYIQLVISLAVAAFCIAMLSRPGVTCETESTYLPILTSTLAYWLPGPQIRDMVPAREEGNGQPAPAPAADAPGEPHSRTKDLQTILEQWKQKPGEHFHIEMDDKRISMEVQSSFLGKQPEPHVTILVPQDKA